MADNSPQSNLPFCQMVVMYHYQKQIHTSATKHTLCNLLPHFPLPVLLGAPQLLCNHVYLFFPTSLTLHVLLQFPKHSCTGQALPTRCRARQYLRYNNTKTRDARLTQRSNASRDSIFFFFFFYLCVVVTQCHIIPAITTSGNAWCLRELSCIRTLPWSLMETGSLIMFQHRLNGAVQP